MQSLRNCVKCNCRFVRTALSTSGLRNLPRALVPHQAPQTIPSLTKQNYAANVLRTYSTENSVPSHEVTYEELRASASDLLTTIIDVRQPEELQETGAVPGSINIPLPVLNEAFNLDEDAFEKLYGHPKPNPGDDILFYCKAGVRSGKALALAYSRGYHRSKHYPGGWLGWVEETAKLSQ